MDARLAFLCFFVWLLVEVHSQGVCVTIHCGAPLSRCTLDGPCRQTIECNANCNGKDNAEACNLLCELRYGYNSTTYKDLLQCMSNNNCLPKSQPDGACLADDSQTIQNLTQMEQVRGRWWIVRGINCGQKGWPGGFDNFPCQYDEFYQTAGDPAWYDKISYCGGGNSICATPYLVTYANVSLARPGVLNHIYTDPPLKPQLEEWRVLSWPHPDWMLYIYCGSVPTGMYAGGSVVTRSDRTVDAMPAYVEAEFRAVASKFNFAYDQMCISDDSKCTN